MSKIYAPLFALLMGWSCASHAQVYKSTDAEGNVIFSDKPIDGGEEIQVPDANVSDPVEVPAYVPPEPKPEVKEEPPQPQVIVVEEDDSEGLSARQRMRRAKRRHHPER